jgi:hypothetical protein
MYQFNSTDPLSNSPHFLARFMSSVSLKLFAYLKLKALIHRDDQETQQQQLFDLARAYSDNALELIACWSRSPWPRIHLPCLATVNIATWAMPLDHAQVNIRLAALSLPPPHDLISSSNQLTTTLRPQWEAGQNTTRQCPKIDVVYA